MARYLVKVPFKGAIGGIYVRDFVLGERAEIDDPDLARVALEGGWIEPCAAPDETAGETPAPNASAQKTPRNKAVKAAPKGGSATGNKDTATE